MRPHPPLCFGRTSRAFADAVWELMRTVSAGRCLRFFSQSADSRPPLSRYSVPSRRANQISISGGFPLARPVVVR